MVFTLLVNGEPRELPGVESPVTLDVVVAALGLAGDRVAVEHNGEIAARTKWTLIAVAQQDRLEVVHFVGGGLTDQA